MPDFCGWPVIFPEWFEGNGQEQLSCAYPETANKDFFKEDLLRGLRSNHPLGNSPQSSRSSQACCLLEGRPLTQRKWKSLLFLPDAWYQPSLWTIRMHLIFDTCRVLLTETLQSSVIFCFWNLLTPSSENTMKGHFKEHHKLSASSSPPPVLHWSLLQDRWPSVKTKLWQAVSFSQIKVCQKPGWTHWQLLFAIYIC